MPNGTETKSARRSQFAERRVASEHWIVGWKRASSMTSIRALGSPTSSPGCPTTRPIASANSCPGPGRPARKPRPASRPPSPHSRPQPVTVTVTATASPHPGWISEAYVAPARPWSSSPGYGCAISRRAAWRNGSADALESFRWRASGAHAADSDHRDGPQTAHRNLAIHHCGRRARGRHPRSLSFDRR